MNFYGVGVTLRGHTKNPKKILDECLENNVWYMGFDEGEKQEYEQLISEIKPGDIIFAKSLHQAWKMEMRIKAIGIVKDKMLPEKHQNNTCVSVIWIKVFQEDVNLKYLNLNFLKETNRRYTIFHERNEKIIAEIERLMRYDYQRSDTI